jgi:phosphoribosylamine--glycine ligase
MHAFSSPMMNILVIGGGGREHALTWSLRQSPLANKIFASPGNPGIAAMAQCIVPASQTPEAYLAVAESIDATLTVVGPEAPLVAGIVDIFRAAGRPVIGPTAQAAQLEGSKVFAKNFMVRAGVPTAKAFTVPTAQAALSRIDEFGFPVVLKADGLAAGKGVIIAQTRAEALDACNTLPQGQLVVEEFLPGEEVSFIIYTDGTRVVPLEATQDHKAVRDGDKGPNTGGMGAYCDGRILSAAQAARVMDTIILPTLDLMRADGIPYTGFLYAGLMMTQDGAKVLEFNTRLGDPETQVLLHRLDSDLLATLIDCQQPVWKPDPSVCVVLAAHGYPGTVRSGDQIEGLQNTHGAVVFHAGTKQTADGVQTAGGRVLGVTASGPDLRQAIANTYAAVNQIHFEGMHYRKDIGQKGLKRW